MLGAFNQKSPAYLISGRYVDQDRRLPDKLRCDYPVRVRATGAGSFS